MKFGTIISLKLLFTTKVVFAVNVDQDQAAQNVHFTAIL